MDKINVTILMEELNRLFDRLIPELDLSVAEAVGVLEVKKQQIINQAIRENEK